MKTDLEIIKELYGESFAKMCRTNFPTILEHHGVLLKIMSETFAENHFLFEDIVKNHKIEEFKNFMFAKFYDLIDSKQIENIPERLIERPEVLMDKAGYVLMHCKTIEDVKKFKRFYAQGEELCTFRDDDRIANWDIFFAVKKNVADIKRENFDHPMRQDEYGTSVISLQFSRGDESILSIKNRYNHTVADPDSTFSNDLENIIAGLTESFEKYYGIKILNGDKNFEIPSYVWASDGKYYPYNMEIGNIYYCPNNILIENLIPRKLDKSTYEMFDYHIFNKKTKKFETKVKDSFTDGLDYIKKIEIGHMGVSKNKYLRLTYNDLEALEVRNFTVIVNERGQMREAYVENAPRTNNPYLVRSNYLKAVVAPNIRNLPESSFQYSMRLLDLDMENLETIGDYSFRNMIDMHNLNLPKVIQIGSYVFDYAPSIIEVNLPEVIRIGDHSFERNAVTEVFNAPKVKNIGSWCFTSNKIKNLDLSNVKEISNHSFTNSNYLESLFLLELKELDYFAFREVERLKVAVMPNVKKIHDECFVMANSLTNLDIRNCMKISRKCFVNTKSLNEIIASELDYIGTNSFENTGLSFASFPKLELMYGGNFNNAQNLVEFKSPKLTIMGKNCLVHASIENLKLESLETAGSGCFAYLENLKSFHAPNALEIQGDCFEYAPNIELFRAEKLITLRPRVLFRSPKLKYLITPSLQNIYTCFDMCDNIELAVVSENCVDDPELKYVKVVSTEFNESMIQESKSSDSKERT